MIPDFASLREDEVQVMLNTPAYVSILIAGADGKIDKLERRKAIEIARNKQIRGRAKLLDFYKLVGEKFEEDFNRLIDELPLGTDARIQAITKELRKLNHILPKLDKKFAIEFYASMKDLAKQISEASGGILGYLSVSYEEAQLVALKMIEEPS